MPVTIEQVLAQLRQDEPDYEQAANLGPEALPHLARLVEEGDPELAPKATYLAGFINAEQSSEVVKMAARSSHPVVRVAAAAALSNLEEMPTSLVERMLDDEDVGVRKLALKSLEKKRPVGMKRKAREVAENDPNVVLRGFASRVADRLP
jgi:HEAT repeat protein